jgi:hypothetical protein
MEQKTIHITSVESTEKKINLFDDKLKYNFFRTKKDGTPTKAELQFQKYRFIAGDTIDAMVEEEPREFMGDKGKMIQFTDRKIAYFMEQDNTPVSTQNAQNATTSPETPQSSTNVASEHSAALKAFLAQMQKSIKDLEEKVKKLEDWKDKQPVFAEVNGKMEVVPNCFEKDEIRPEDII